MDHHGAMLVAALDLMGRPQDIKLIREDLATIKGWLHHWEQDRLCGLPCTENSLSLADARISHALVILDRIEKEAEL